MIDCTVTAPDWAADPCPPPPLVLAGELALPPGRACLAPRLLGDVHVTHAVVTAGDRARAVALCAAAGHGVLVRATAAGVWSGEPSLLPRHVDLATPAGGPRLPGPRPVGGRTGLPVRATRWEAPHVWVLLGGVGVSDLARTAADCARLLPGPLARRCLEALAEHPGFDGDDVAVRLRAAGPRPGLRQALDLLQAQSSTTSRCTPLVTR